MDNQWMDDAVCRQVGVQEFFPDKGESAKVRIAKEICSACPVVAECLAFGINEPFGIWGGTTEVERRKIRKLQRNNSNAA
jgi:WhiB family redox-sensing transcriptional regulator